MLSAAGQVLAAGERRPGGLKSYVYRPQMASPSSQLTFCAHTHTTAGCRSFCFQQETLQSMARISLRMWLQMLVNDSTMLDSEFWFLGSGLWRVSCRYSGLAREPRDLS